VSTEPERPELSLETGYARVDDQTDPSFLVAVMDQTAAWGSIVSLRAFEADELALGPGDALLDVGCGRGEVACALAPLVVPGGRVVGVDASEAMLGDARARAGALGVEVAFRPGDALALAEPDASFDAVRSERMLQWLPDPAAAVGEMARVLRPGGRLCLLDTDWRTLAVDIPDVELAARVTTTILRARGASSAAGGLLVNLCRQHGLVDVVVQPATQVWTAWDPTTEVAPSGLWPLDAVLADVVAEGHLDDASRARFLDQLLQRAHEERFFMSLTMFAVVARRP